MMMEMIRCSLLLAALLVTTSALSWCGVCRCSRYIVYCAGRNLSSIPQADQLDGVDPQAVQILSLQVSILPQLNVAYVG